MLKFIAKTSKTKDLILPGMSGFELKGRIKHGNSKTLPCFKKKGTVRMQKCQISSGTKSM